MSRHSRLFRLLSGTVGALALVLLTTGRADADPFALGSGFLELTEFKFVIGDENGENVSAGDLDDTAFSNDASVIADLDSAGTTADFELGTEGDVNLLRVCEPDCTNAPAEDDFSALTAFPPTDHFVSADQRLEGPTIDVGPTPAGATASTSAHVSLTSPDEGTGVSETGTTSSFTFTAGSALDGETLTVRFDYSAQLFAQLSSDAGAGSNVNVATTWQIQIQDITDPNNVIVLLNVSPEELQLQAAADLLGLGPDDTGLLMGSLFFTTNDDLVAGNTYRVIIDHTTTAKATVTAVVVPEPASLALMAGGLMLLALFGLRRRSDGSGSTS